MSDPRAEVDTVRVVRDAIAQAWTGTSYGAGNENSVDAVLDGLADAGQMVVPRDFVESVMYSGSFDLERLGVLRDWAEHLIHAVDDDMDAR